MPITNMKASPEVLAQVKGTNETPPVLSGAGIFHESETEAGRTGKGRRIAGRIVTALATLFLLFDAMGKVATPPPVMEAFLRLGFPTRLSLDVAILLFAGTILYAIPRTAVFGAVLLTGYFGGAVAIQMRAGSPVFETVFPVLLGALVWAGIYLRECRLAQIFPLRR